MSMFCWGANNREGFGLVPVHPDSVHTNTGIHYICPKSVIQEVSAGKRLVAFIRGDGIVSVVRTQEDQDGNTNTGKLSRLLVNQI